MRVDLDNDRLEIVDNSDADNDQEEPSENRGQSQLTKSLIMTIFGAVIGCAATNGYNTGVINPPQVQKKQR